ncbi:MAG: cytochrome c maturation protein CcmE [Burkholderiales bacterium]
MKPRHKRFVLIGVGIGGLALSATLVLSAFQKNLVFFYTPSQVFAKEAPVGKSFRIGGLVENGSLRREADGVTVQFVVTDTAKSIPVYYRGILPDLFKEGKGVVTEGKLAPDGTFHADEVLAKHDENYMPPAAQEAINEARASTATSTLVVPAKGK